ncbi:hypothetical protein M5K25_026468 [Dendrobium thyrsiflorum]|uniref:Uncharacterized protein n=1 Tax=Dendrobium thyrsiflorum TaxID=117978 RepID=A0ABD0TXF0_DENTH
MWESTKKRIVIGVIGSLIMKNYYLRDCPDLTPKVSILPLWFPLYLIGFLLAGGFSRELFWGWLFSRISLLAFPLPCAVDSPCELVPSPLSPSSRKACELLLLRLGFLPLSSLRKCPSHMESLGESLEGVKGVFD